jgi:hypothetical protein
MEGIGEEMVKVLKEAGKEVQLDALCLAWIGMMADGEIEEREIESIVEFSVPLGLKIEEITARVAEVTKKEIDLPDDIIVEKKQSLIGKFFSLIWTFALSIIVSGIGFYILEETEVLVLDKEGPLQLAIIGSSIVLAILWFRIKVKSKKNRREQQIVQKEERDKEVSEKEKMHAEGVDEQRKQFGSKLSDITDRNSRYEEFKERKEKFYKDNGLTIKKNGNLRDSDYQEYEEVESSDDYIEFKPEGLRAKRAFIKIAKSEIENEMEYLAWSGPIDLSDKAAFLRGDFKKAEEESQPVEEAPVQEQEVENIEVKQEKESETDATMSISERLNELTKLYDEGILTKEELKKKSDELISQM